MIKRTLGMLLILIGALGILLSALGIMHTWRTADTHSRQHPSMVK